MSSLKSIKEKISGIKKTSKLTSAMESISAIKMRGAQKQAIAGRYYAFLLFSVLKRLSKIIGENVDDIFSEVIPQKGKTLILLIAPDKGLTGGMNNALFKKTLAVIEENDFLKDTLAFVCVGKKAKEFVEKNDFYLLKYFASISEKSEMEVVKEVSDYLIRLYRKKEYSRFLSIYTNFINTTTQKPVSHTIIPVVFSELKSFLKSILPDRGKYSDLGKIDIDHSDTPCYIFEPDIHKVLQSLIPFALNVSIYYSLLEAFASEHSARMISMKNATDKALEITESLNKEYNKKRQEIITSEISEIVSGMEAMRD